MKGISDEVQSLFTKGAALHNQGKYQETIDYYDQVLKMDSDYIPAKSNKQIALEKKNKNQYIQLDTKENHGYID